ncbi:MAG: ABC transporter substrate-binding protein [Actinomycetota bacterium]|nr:ABC transporter substrate-binding protein [Actinomycetota bacterium]
MEQQVLTVGADEDGFQSPTTRPRLGMYPLNANICEPLVSLTEDFGVAPVLATGWEYVGGNTFRFHLREGVTFHNGQPFTAAAVKYSMDRLVEKKIDFLAFLGPESTKVIDDRTVEITPTQPNLRLVEQLVHPTYSIIALGTEPADEPVCTGPFRFREYVPNERLAVERYEHYWGEKARLKEMTFRFIPDDNTRRLALESGEVDVIFDPPRQQARDIEARPDLEVAKAPPGAVFVIKMNVKGNPPYDILRSREVRRALALSFDRQALVDLWDGNAEVVPTVNPPSALGQHARLVEGLRHNPDEAARLLEAQGWTVGGDGIRQKGGRGLSLVMLVGPNDDLEPLQLLQAQARQVGIDIQLQPVAEGASVSDRIGAGEFDLNAFVPNQNDANPAFLLTLQWYGKSRVPWTTYQHPGGEFDRLVDRALQTPELEEARRLAAEAQHVLIDQDTAAIPLVGVFRIYAMKRGVEGLDAHPSQTNQPWVTVYRTK